MIWWWQDGTRLMLILIDDCFVNYEFSITNYELLWIEYMSDEYMST